MAQGGEGEPMRGAAVEPEAAILGGVASDEGVEELEALNVWMGEQGLPQGQLPYEVQNPKNGRPLVVLDLV